MTVTDMLRAQHLIITSQISCLENLCRSKKFHHPEIFRQSALCVLAAVNEHASTEQELMKELRKHFVNLDKTADGIDIEHDQIERTLKAIRAAQTAPDLRRIILKFSIMLKKHMRKEETYLFKLAEAVLSPEQLGLEDRKTKRNRARLEAVQ